MKRCPYCGVEYPDSETFCPADQEKLIDLSASKEGDPNSPRQPDRKLHAGGIVCIVIGAIQLIASTSLNAGNAQAARIIFIISALMAVILIGAGIYLILEKADRDY